MVHPNSANRVSMPLVQVRPTDDVVVGARLVADGLKSAVALNGQTGTVIDVQHDRYVLHFGPHAGEKALRPENLFFPDAAASPTAAPASAAAASSLPTHSAPVATKPLLAFALLCMVLVAWRRQRVGGGSSAAAAAAAADAAGAPALGLWGGAATTPALGQAVAEAEAVAKAVAAEKRGRRGVTVEQGQQVLQTPPLPPPSLPLASSSLLTRSGGGGGAVVTSALPDDGAAVYTKLAAVFAGLLFPGNQGFMCVRLSEAALVRSAVDAGRVEWHRTHPSSPPQSPYLVRCLQRVIKHAAEGADGRPTYLVADGSEPSAQVVGRDERRFIVDAMRWVTHKLGEAPDLCRGEWVRRVGAAEALFLSTRPDACKRLERAVCARAGLVAHYGGVRDDYVTHSGRFPHFTTCEDVPWRESAAP